MLTRILIASFLLACTYLAASANRPATSLTVAATLYGSYDIEAVVVAASLYDHYEPRFLNDSGLIAGTVSNHSGDQVSRPFVVRSGTAVRVFDLPEQEHLVFATGLNNRGELLLHEAWDGGSRMYLGFASTGRFTALPSAVWVSSLLSDKAETMIGVPTGSGKYRINAKHSRSMMPLKGDNYTWMFDMNSRGMGVGFSMASFGSEFGTMVVWNNGGQPDVVWPVPLKVSEWRSTGLNNKGDFILTRRYDEDGFVRKLAYLVSVGGSQQLGGSPNLDVFDMNDNGDVIAQGFDPQGPIVRSLLFRNGLPNNMEDLIPTGSGWESLTPLALNNKGQITGIGTFQGKVGVFLMTPRSTAP